MAKKTKKVRKIKKPVSKKPVKRVVKNKTAKSAPMQNEEIPLKKTKIRVFGIGGGGGSIISEIASRVSKASFVAVNCDNKALKEVNKKVAKFHFGEEMTHGLGTGMNAQVGELAALAEKDRLAKLFEGQDFCIFVACLGGGTGSGATKVLAKMARNSGCMTLGILTLPFSFEGEKKTVIAKNAVESLKNRLHAYSVIPNERIFQIIQKETPLKAALSAINARLASSLEGLIEIIYDPGLINIDFADFKSILEGQGRLTYLNTVDVPRKEGAVQESVDKLLNSPLYPYGIKGAKGVLYNIAGQSGLTLYEVSQISKSISELVNKEAKIIFGISQNQKYGSSIKTTVLATGCGAKIFPNNHEEAKEKDENKKKEEKPKAKIKNKKIRKPVTSNKEKTKKRGQKKSQKRNAGKKTVRNRKKKKVFPKKIKVNIVPETESETAEKSIPLFDGQKTEEPVRKNALQVKEEADLQEAEMITKEKVWETPAFLRRKKD